jgi:hypothetical protein
MEMFQFLSPDRYGNASMKVGTVLSQHALSHSALFHSKMRGFRFLEHASSLGRPGSRSHSIATFPRLEGKPQ